MGSRCVLPDTQESLIVSRLTLSMQSVAPPNPEERAPVRKSKKHVYEIDVEEETVAARQRDDTQGIAPDRVNEEVVEIITPPPTRARPSPAGQKRKTTNLLTNTVDSCQSRESFSDLNST